MATHLPYIVCLNREVIAQGAPRAVFTDETLTRLYGAPMRVVREGDVTVVVDHPELHFGADARVGTGAA